MTDTTETVEEASPTQKLPIAAVVLALIGLVDSIYLTVKHLRDEKVPCSLISGCETVLSSTYAEVGGVPLAAFGAAAYFVAFSLALLAAFG
ncbi:MAG TPA: vitamin K epoxide reductase family protein, partial [Pyrinomonadaceae bacterium]|nr:vitamin K epoxide reductase family protein [Pyrinomonadaceae bacterium]